MAASRQPVREYTGLSLGIAGATVTFLVFLAALLVVTIYTFITVYAIVKAIGSAPTSPSALTVLLGVMGLVTAFCSLLAGAIALLGRAMNPRRRPGDRNTEPFGE
jgi:hypothetical protein